MKYSEFRNVVKDGDVITFAGNWWMSRAIRFFTGQPVSHVGFAMWLRFGYETEDRLCVLESLEPGGIRVVPMVLAMNDSTHVYWQRARQDHVRPGEALGWAIQQWGGKYASWFQFLSFISPRFRWFRSWFFKNPKIGHGYHCSELVATALEFGGWKPTKPPCLTTPGDIWMFSCLEPAIMIEEG